MARAIREPTLSPLTDGELRAALAAGYTFWARSTGTPVNPAVLEELTVQQLVAIRRAAQQHTLDLRPPAPAVPLKHWSDVD